MGNHENDLKELQSLVVKLAKEIDWKNHVLMEMSEKSVERSAAMAEKDRLLKEHMSKTRQMEIQNEKLRHEMEAQKRELELRTMELEECKTRIEEGQVTLVARIGKAKWCLESLENEAEFHEEELEMYTDQNHMMQGQSVGKEMLMQLEDQNMRIKVEDLKAELKVMKKELEEKEDSLHFMENLNNTLMLKERRSNEELQAARKEAIIGLETMASNRMTLGIKRMGEVDRKPFQDACLKKFCSGEREEKSAQLCSLWQEKLHDANWHPFKKETIDGKQIEMIDENDEELKELREEWGDEVYKAVVDAMLDMNEYNPSGRYVVRELWNFKEGRRASLKEVIRYIIKQWKTQKNKKR